MRKKSSKSRKKQKSNSKSNVRTNIEGVAVSAVISLAVLTFLTLVLSLLLLKAEKISSSFLMPFYTCSAISAFVCGFISSKKCDYKGILAGVISSVIFNFILIIIFLFVCDGQIRPDTGFLIGVNTVFSGIGGITGANTKRRK